MHPTYVQIASIIIEVVLVVLTVIGLKVPVTNAVLKKTAKVVVENLQKSSAFRQAVTKFVESWDSASNFFNKAKALSYLLSYFINCSIIQVTTWTQGSRHVYCLLTR